MDDYIPKPLMKPVIYKIMELLKRKNIILDEKKQITQTEMLQWTDTYPSSE
jgi:hypothetical protein